MGINIRIFIYLLTWILSIIITIYLFFKTNITRYHNQIYQTAIIHNIDELRTSNGQLLKRIEDVAYWYPSHSHQKYLTDAKIMYYFIDSTINYMQNEGIEIVELDSVFKSIIIETSSIQGVFESEFLKEADINKISLILLDHYSNNKEKLIYNKQCESLLKNICTLQLLILQSTYLQKILINCPETNLINGLNTPQAINESIFPKIGDTLNIDIVFSPFYLYDPFIERKFFLNNKELQVNSGQADFQISYEYPGIYPLNVEIEMYDVRQQKWLNRRKTYNLKLYDSRE